MGVPNTPLTLWVGVVMDHLFSSTGPRKSANSQTQG